MGLVLIRNSSVHKQETPSMTSKVTVPDKLYANEQKLYHMSQGEKRALCGYCVLVFVQIFAFLDVLTPVDFSMCWHISMEVVCLDYLQ